MYYCISRDTYYSIDYTVWPVDENVNVEGDPYGDLVTGSDGVNVEG